MIEKTQDGIRKLEEPLEDNGNIAFNNWHSFTDGKNSENRNQEHFVCISTNTP
jgi:hypothetical protein